MAFKVAVVNARTGRDQRAIAREYIAAAALQGCQLVCLPEGFLSLVPTGHSVFCTMDSAAVANMVDAARTYDIHVLTGMWERTEPKCYLSALYIAPDGMACVIHRKLVPAMRERRKGVSSGQDLAVQKTSLCIIGASLCLENWLPEIPRALALAGAELIYAPSYIGLAVQGRFDYYHGLAEQESAGAALRPALKPLERLGQQQAHACGDIVLGEEPLSVDMGQIVNVVDRIADGRVEHRPARRTSLRKRLEHSALSTAAGVHVQGKAGRS